MFSMEILWLYISLIVLKLNVVILYISYNGFDNKFYWPSDFSWMLHFCTDQSYFPVTLR